MNKILCIDDDLSVTSALQRVLHKEFEVHTVATIAEARKFLKTHNDCAIVLADQTLPDGKGLDFLKELRSQYPGCVRAVLSGQIDLRDLSTALNDGIIHRLILKPWDNDYLQLQMLEALQNHRLLNEKFELEKLATTDQVTQLVNHRYFQDRFKVEFDRAARHGRSLALVMIDIDRFKNLNDRFGHPTGDSFLRATAVRLLAGVRGIDIVARYGGDEFAILMPDTLAPDALKVADRLRQSFSEEPLSFGPGVTERVTVSLGIATSLGRKTRQELLETADRALYKAKALGRNQTVAI